MSDKLYKLLVDNALSIIMRFDKDGRITFFNNYAGEIFGYAEGEIIGKTIWETIVPPQESTGRNLFTLLEEIIKQTNTYSFNENENITKSGERIWIEWRNSFIYNEAGGKEILAVGMDITDKKRAEVELKQAKEEAEKATKLKDRFVSLVSHDLKSPFLSIVGLLELLVEDEENPLTEKQKTIITHALMTSSHLTKVIDRLLDSDRLRNGVVQLKIESLNIYEMVEVELSKFRYLAEGKGISLINHVDKATLYADEGILGNVISNLVSNAIKFTSRGGQIVISSHIGDMASIVVQDYGCGIGDRIKEDIFKYDIKTTTLGTDGERGTGMGLPYCKEMMIVHGGDLSLNSAIGQGSIFTMLFPCKQEDRRCL